MYAFTTLSAQTFALKSNLLYDAAAVPELSVEVRTAKSATFSLSAVYNPISYSDSRQWKTWSVNPELRFWGCRPFFGFFWGVNVLGGEFNVGKFPLFGAEHKRSEGSFFGGGLSLGYHKILSPHWGVETGVSVDYLHIRYSRYRCGHCGYREETLHRNWVGPVRLSLSLVYMIR